MTRANVSGFHFFFFDHVHGKFCSNRNDLSWRSCWKIRSALLVVRNKMKEKKKKGRAYVNQGRKKRRGREDSQWKFSTAKFYRRFESKNKRDVHPLFTTVVQNKTVEKSPRFIASMRVFYSRARHKNIGKLCFTGLRV